MLSSSWHSSACMSFSCVNPSQFCCVWIVSLTFWTEWKISEIHLWKLWWPWGANRHYVCRLRRCWNTGGGLWDKIRWELYRDLRVIRNVLTFIVKSIDMAVRGFLRLWLTMYCSRNLLLRKYLCRSVVLLYINVVSCTSVRYCRSVGLMNSNVGQLYCCTLM